MSEVLAVKKDKGQSEYQQKQTVNNETFYRPDLQISGGETKINQMPDLSGIPADLKKQFEEQSGFSFDDVRVHYNSYKPAQLQALAYAQGNQIYIGPGQEMHLEHELGHVVQQKQGIVQPTTVVNGVPVNDDPELEIGASHFLAEGSSYIGKKESPGTVVQRLMTVDEFRNKTKAFFPPRGKHNGQYYDRIERLLEEFDGLSKNTDKCICLSNLIGVILIWKQERPDSRRAGAREELLTSARNEIQKMYAPLKDIIRSHIEAAQMPVLDNRAGEDGLWNKVKENFQCEKNIITLISKILSLDTQGVSDFSDRMNMDFNFVRYIVDTVEAESNDVELGPGASRIGDSEYDPLLPRDESQSEDMPIQYTKNVRQVFDNLGTAISETLNDIYYWMNEKKATDITEILLTDSDLHTRGVGVCIVNYKEGNDSKQIVIKPEDKSFEQAVYGKGGNSLASDFNSKIEAGMIEPLTRPVGELTIETSEENKFGSAVGFFEHQKYRDISVDNKSKIDIESVNSLIAFASLLGLADLHVENAVYSIDPDAYKFQMIDAEIGLKYVLDEKNPFRTALTKGEMLNESYRQNSSVSEDESTLLDAKYLKNLLREFLDNVKNSFADKSSRLVILETSKLFGYRADYLAGIWDVYKKDEYYEAFLNRIENFFPKYLIRIENMISKEDFIDAAEDDFSFGRIPYFTLSISSGELLQGDKNGKHICTFMNAVNVKIRFLDTMIADRIKTLGLE